MSAPFEKFVTTINASNEFCIRVSSPKKTRANVEKGNFKDQSREERNQIALERLIFIESAIREKLEREKEGQG